MSLRPERLNLYNSRFAEQQTANYCQKQSSDLQSWIASRELVFEQTQASSNFLASCRAALQSAHSDAEELRMYLGIPASDWTVGSWQSLGALTDREQVISTRTAAYN